MAVDRRAFIGQVALGVLAAPRLAKAQQTVSPPVVGFLSSRSPEESRPHVASFLQGLSAAGYDENRNIAIEYRWANGHYEKLPGLARELLRLNVRIIAAVGGEPSALAAKGATSSVPIVFLIGGDPVKMGLVQSFNRPGGNLTGVTFFTAQLGGKRLGLLCELVQNANVVALLLNPHDPGAQPQREDVQMTANALGRQLIVLNATNEADLASVFARLTREHVGALVVENDPFFDSQRNRLIALAAQNRVPAIYHIREFPAAGGLMSYGTSLADAYGEVGTYVARILKGDRPAEMPVIRPTKFELVVNQKAANALGLSIPPSILVRADEVIR